jgi:hypothetical protein
VKIGEAANNSGTLVDDLASVDAGKGSGLVGFSGSTKLDGEGKPVTSIPAGTVESAIKAVDAKVDTLEQTVGDGRFLGTETLTDQTVKSNVTFKKDIIIEGDIIHNGENLIAQGTTVELGDSVLLLNRNLAAGATPSVDVGLQANRGKNGTNDLIIWKESEKQLKGIKVVTTEVEGVETEVVTLERITLSSDLSTAVSGLNTTINSVKSELEGDIDVVADSVSDLSGELNTYKSDVLSSASDKGATLVGYANSDVLVAANGETPALTRTSKVSLTVALPFKITCSLVTALVKPPPATNTSEIGKSIQNLKIPLSVVQCVRDLYLPFFSRLALI